MKSNLEDVDKRKIISLLVFLSLLFLTTPPAYSVIGTFNATTGAAINFTGDGTKFLQVESSTSMNMGGGDFTISWWQKTPSPQTLYPRILQFGHGVANQSNFAISEEEGRIYLWIGTKNVTSMAIPENSVWHHIAIIRTATDFRWFLDGVFVSVTSDPNPISFDTSGLDLLIGSGDDAGTGGFTGNVTGLQISQSVRWTGSDSFEPPTDFLNPGTGLAFSMYVSETEVLDKSGNTRVILPVALSASDFSDFNPPVPTPPPPTEVLRSILWWEDWGWNSEITISKDEAFSAPYDYLQIKTVSIAIPLTFTDAGGQLRKTKCHIDIAGKWTSDTSEIRIQLGFFDLLARYQFPEQCQTGTGYSAIPDYTPGLFGTDKVLLDFVIWTETITAITDLTNVNSAYEKFSQLIDLPPEVTSYSITRGPTSETEDDRISFGDTITVSVWNETATAYAAMRFHVPEARYASGDNPEDPWCAYLFDVIDSDGVFDRSFALPTLETLLTSCRTQYDGTWEYDQSVDRSFNLLIADSGGAAGNSITLTLNAVAAIDWSLYPSSVGRYDTFWGTTATFNNDIGDPQYDYSNIKHVSLGLPISYTDSTSATVNATCHFPLPDESIHGDDRYLEVEIPEFSVIANNLDLICGYEIPSYTHGMLGETQTDLIFYLWTQTEVVDYELISSAFEAVPVTLDLPPEVSGYTITRGSSSETDNSKIYSGDTLTVNIINQVAMYDLEFTIAAPESKQVEVEADPLNSCSFRISTDSSGVIPTSFLIPTAEEISTQCHIEWNDAWTYDLTANRLVSIVATDYENNGFIFNGPTLMGTPAPTPPAPTPPAPTPPAPTPPAPTPPTPPTPPAPPTPEPEPTPTPTPTPAPVPEPILVPTPMPTPVPAPTPTPVSKPTPTPVPVKTENLEASLLKAKACTAQGVWIYTKSGLLQICDTELKVVLATRACAGKSSSPTFPWVFKAQRFKAGYSTTQSGQLLYYSTFFFKGLAIAGVEKVSTAPCSNGSVFVDKKASKKVYEYLKEIKAPIWVKNH